MLVGIRKSNPLETPAAGEVGSEALRCPEEPKLEWIIALGLFLFAIGWLYPFHNYTLLNADEGIILQGAQQILAGQVPYRDFFTFYTPGSYYWTALLFRLFGDSILTARAALLVYGGLFAILTYFLARRVSNRWASVLAAYVAVVVCLPYKFVVLHNWDSTLAAYAALYAAVRALEGSGGVWAVAAGFFMAATCLTEQSKGAGLVLGLVVGLAIVAYAARGRMRLRSNVPFLLAGFLAPFLVTIVYFTAVHGLTHLLTDCLWPLRHYSAVNRTAFAGLQLSGKQQEALWSGSWAQRVLVLITLGPTILLPLLALTSVAVLAYWVWRISLPKGGDARARYYVVICATLAGLLASTFATGRPDFVHLAYLGPLFCLVLAWLLDDLGNSSHLLAFLRPLLVTVFLLSSSAFGLALLSQPLSAHQRLLTRRGTLKGQHPDYILPYVQANVASGQKMLVYPYHPLYNYLTATYSPLRYEYLQAGMHTPEQYRQALCELRTARTPVVLYEPSFNAKVMPTFPSTPVEVLAASDPVADYIAASYRPCASLTSQNFWYFVFMVRRDLACPRSKSSE
jgi:4-amino-4-deoxy-L-arabinose transferase-like glycosyltransferase